MLSFGVFLVLRVLTLTFPGLTEEDFGFCIALRGNQF
jgi:hypothetical protein